MVGLRIMALVSQEMKSLNPLPVSISSMVIARLTNPIAIAGVVPFPAPNGVAPNCELTAAPSRLVVIHGLSWHRGSDGDDRQNNVAYGTSLC